MSSPNPRVLRPPASTETGVAKRGRKARPSFTDDDKQRERKRAMDRKAQRVSREKTRSHIAHLEKMVEILCEKNESEATTELMAEVSRLNAEIDRLRKIIEAIKSVLRADSFEMESQSQGRQNNNSNSSRSGSQNRDAAEEIKAFSAPKPAQSPQQQQQQQQQQHMPVFDDFDDPPTQEQRRSHKRARTASFLAPIEEVEPVQRQQPVQLPEPEFPEPHPTLNFTPAWSAAVVPRRRNPHNRSMSVSQIGTLPSQLWSQLYPQLPPSISTFQAPPTTSPCRIWQKSNRIYAKMFSIKKNASWAADEITTGTLFKAVKEGWGSLPDNLQVNPVLDVLREIDVEVFPRLDRVTRTALMIKSHLLMKYFLNPHPSNFSLMPTWQRPVQSQSTLQHPIAIDFFAWPGLRDRLVSHHAHYFANPPKSRAKRQSPDSEVRDPTAGIADFSVAYQHHFRFSWPFTFDDAYLYDPVTEEYSISPMFERYHSDLKYWGVEPVFFEKFPEFKGVMSQAHVYEPREGPGDVGTLRAVSPADTDTSTSPPRDAVPGVGSPIAARSEDRRESSDSLSCSTVSSQHAPSPEEVQLDSLNSLDDIEIMENLDGTFRQTSSNDPSGEGMTFEFDAASHGLQEAAAYGLRPPTLEQRDGSGKVVFEGQDAYLMELFNDLPRVA